MKKPSHEPERGFYIESAGGSVGLRKNHELGDVMAVADEIVANQQAGRTESAAPELVVHHIDEATVWANYNRAKGTPTTASTLPTATVDRAEIERRLHR